jgi:hypothetical protein
MSTMSAPVRQSPAISLVQRYRHRTPRYIVDRTRQMLYECAHPEDPWLAPAAIDLLRSLRRPADRGLEFGSGRSTVWFDECFGALTSVEHDERWHALVSATLKAKAFGNVDYILAPETSRWSAAGKAPTPVRRSPSRTTALTFHRRALPGLLGQVHPAQDKAGRNAYH